MEAIAADLPLVSILITSYNRADMIGDAIESALAQDYPNVEVVITDNCSQDHTKEVVGRYQDDPRIKFYQNEENIGMLPNFKKGLEELCTGQYFVNLCSDDQLTNEQFISTAVGLLQKHPDVKLVRGRNQVVNKGSGKISRDDGSYFKTEFVKGQDFFLQCNGNENFGWEAVLIHLETFNSLDIFSRSYSAIDKGSNMELLLHGNVCFIDQISYTFTVHHDSHTFNPSAESSFKNFEMVESLHEKALTMGQIDENVLGSWKEKFILNLSAKAARALYIRDKGQYRAFVDKVGETYGIKAKELKKGFKTKMDYILYHFPAVGRGLSKIFGSISKLFNSH